MEALLGHPDDNMVVSEIGISEPWEPMQIVQSMSKSCKEMLEAYVIGEDDSSFTLAHEMLYFTIQ